jgi:hypothetical protein
VSAPTKDQEGFAYDLAQLTGLAPNVILAWTLAEGGPSDNPLNIGPGKHYGNPYKAAAETSKLLHTPRYASILASAHGTPEQQIHAIALSPWDLGKVGPKPTYENLIRGTFARVSGVDITTAISPSGLTQTKSAVTGWVGDLTGWVEGSAAKAAAYVLLSLAALALIVKGLDSASGGSISGAMRGAGAAAGEGVIPF